MEGFRNPLQIRMLAKDKVCAVVAAADAASMLRQLEEALRLTRTIELRLDWLADDDEIARFLRRLSALAPQATLLATCRRRPAGGRYRGPIANQLVHLAEAIRSGCEWYDLEVETSSLCPPELLEVLLGEGKRLASAHFFKAIPQNLAAVARQLEYGNPGGIKVAAHCESLRECEELARFGQRRPNAIVIPMGDVALAARILGLRKRSGLAYAPVENATAPGQVPLREMMNVYRAGKIGAQTGVYGVIGDPIGHSLSPHMHNAGFCTCSMDAVYVPILVHDLHDFIGSIEWLGIKGFSVTIPHKERILSHLSYCDPLAGRIGAVNTVIVRGKRELYGYNTDYVGVLRALERRFALRGSRVLIVGAGGVARAVAFALAEAGAVVCVSGRRQKKARAIADAVGGTLVERNRLRHESFDAIVNATPVGMHPLTGDSPLEARDLNCDIVFDTIYRPRQTKLLQLAARRGIETISGVEMFVAQGAAQWELWTGEPAPVAAMRRAVSRVLEREEKTQKN